MSKGKAIRRVLSYLNPHRRLIAIIWVMMIVGILFSLVPTYLMEPLTDRVLNPVEPATFEERVSLLGWLVFLFFSVQLIGQGIGILRGRLIVKLGVHISHQLRRKYLAICKTCRFDISTNGMRAR